MTLAPLPLVLSALATYRLATAIAREDGPWRVFARLRKGADAERAPGVRQWPTWIAEGLSCPRCISMWAAPVMLLAQAAGPATSFVVTVLAVSGAACVLAEVA